MQHRGLRRRGQQVAAPVLRQSDPAGERFQTACCQLCGRTGHRAVHAAGGGRAGAQQSIRPGAGAASLREIRCESGRALRQCRAGRRRLQCGQPARQQLAGAARQAARRNPALRAEHHRTPGREMGAGGCKSGCEAAAACAMSGTAGGRGGARVWQDEACLGPNTAASCSRRRSARELAAGHAAARHAAHAPAQHACGWLQFASDSLRLDVGELGQLAPLLDFLRDERGERPWRRPGKARRACWRCTAGSRPSG